jgi:hypothetical protein
MIVFKNRQVIGTFEVIEIPEANMFNIPAKVDTGAYYSSIWASHIKETGDGLKFVLFDKNSSLFNGQVITSKKFYKSIIRNSFGIGEERYRVKLSIKVGTKSYKTDFTLANRSINNYPILLGRSLLHDRFIINVTKKDVHFNHSKAKLLKDK